jgi:tetratricopeptide (TPR) repeat protein
MALIRGSIADIEARLMLWATRESADLVRVEFVSEISRQRVWHTLKTGLSEKGVPVHEVALPVQADPEVVVRDLIVQLEKLPPGLVSITGFARAFNNSMSLPEAQVILNFNRDRYIHPGLRQIWWMTPTFLHTAVHTMPDMNSWFSYKLQLTEVLPVQDSGVIAEPMDFHDGAYSNINDAYKRVDGLLQRLRQAQAAGNGANDQELLTTYLLPALESLAEVGAHQKLRDLTLQFEGLLGQLHEGDSIELAIALSRIANLYQDQGSYAEAEPLYLRSLKIREKHLGEEHPDTSTSLNNIAELYRSMGRYKEAEPLYLRSLKISEKHLGEEHPDTAVSLNNVATLYQSMGRYEEAEPLYLRSLKIREKQLGEEHPDTATSLNNIAGLYESMGRYEEAEPLFLRSLEIWEKQLGEEHPSTAISLNNIAILYYDMEKYEEAEKFLIRLLAICEKNLGSNHPNTLRFYKNSELIRSAMNKSTSVDR